MTIRTMWLPLLLLMAGASAWAQRGGGIVVIEAQYGTGDRTCDVTRTIASRCDGRASCDFDAGNALCGDPARGERKALGVVYRCGRSGGPDVLRVYGEGSRGELSCGAGFDGGQAGGRGLYIDYVSYGVGSRVCDATRAFSQQCDGRSRCEIEVNNRLCGDPARNQRKYAEVEYRCNGRSLRDRVDEGRYASLTCR